MSEAKRHLFRDAEAGEALELLLVSAVASVLVIRAFLAATGYPQLGGGRLHIAHMLWGGLFMLSALVLLLVYWNPVMRLFAAVLAGIGFGTFIDELGKFITRDNNYFYEPTIALLYIIFILMFLLIRSMPKKTSLNQREVSLNAEIRKYCEQTDAALGSRISFYFVFRDWLKRKYGTIVLQRWFAHALTMGFIALGLGELFAVAAFVITGTRKDPSIPLVQGAASLASACCIWVGIWRLRRSRLTAYAWFNRSVLINIYVTQTFIFYDSQFSALGGLVVNILIYVALRYMASQERPASV